MKNPAQEELVRALRKEAEQGRIPCQRALALARRLGVCPPLVGQAANEEGIKIVDCQLGCFGRRRSRRAEEKQ